MLRSSRLLAVLAALFLVSSLAAAFAPTGRFQDTCGPWLRPDPAGAVDESERIVAQTYADLRSEHPDWAIAVAGPSAEEVEQACSTEHEVRGALTVALALLGAGTLVWLRRTRWRTDRAPATAEGPAGR